MTVQELLLQDGGVILPISASKLQSIILTLRDYKQKAESMTIAYELEASRAKDLAKALLSINSELEQLKQTKVRCHSINLDLGDLL